MELNITLTNVDYVSLISFASEKAGNLAGKFLKGNLNTLAAHAVNISNGFICSKIQKICSEKGVFVSFDSIAAKAVSSEIIVLTLNVQHIDVLSVIKAVLPGLQKKCSENPQTQFIAAFLKEHDDKAMDTVEHFWNLLDSETQNQLLKDALNAYSAELIHLVEEIALSKSLKFEICEFSVQ